MSACGILFVMHAYIILSNLKRLKEREKNQRKPINCHLLRHQVVIITLIGKIANLPCGANSSITSKEINWIKVTSGQCVADWMNNFDGLMDV